MYTHMTFTGKGFIGKAEVKTTNGGSRIGTLRVAVNNSWKDKTTGEKRERTDWFTVTLFAEGLLDMIEKGWLDQGPLRRGDRRPAGEPLDRSGSVPINGIPFDVGLCFKLSKRDRRCGPSPASTPWTRNG